MPNQQLVVFKAYTACEMVYPSAYALAYDLENNKLVFKNWSVLMNGKIYTVHDWLEWFYNKYIRLGASFYEKV